MRKLGKAAVAAVAATSSVFVLLSAASAAGSVREQVCRDYAETAANIWSRDYIQPAADLEKPGANDVVVIAAGRKYFVPQRQPDEVNAHLSSVGALIDQRDQVYNEEFLRCLGINAVKVKVNVTVQE